MLLRHGWLAPLLKPPTITEDDEAEKAAEAGADQHSSHDPHPETADKEIADWVLAALERKRTGQMPKSEKPALHAVALDAVPGGHGARTMMDHESDEPAAQRQQADVVVLEANPGITVEMPELNLASIETKDFAGEIKGDGAAEDE